ncbi:hypothetical protein D3C78_1916770 [compost metagenome]
MRDEDAAGPATPERILAYMRRQLSSGRVKPTVLVAQTQLAFPEASHEFIVACFNQLDSPLLKR